MKKLFAITYLIILLAIPIVVWVLPVDFFDEGQTVCLSVSLFNTECLGCGMTKALMHLMHFDVSSAIFYNMLSLVVLPLLLIVWLGAIKNVVKTLKLL
jgi:hypothetical protein